MKTKYLFILILLASCTTVKQIGQVNMVSHRNIDASTKYTLLKSYVNSTDDELKQSKASSLEQAIDETVQLVPGGEYLMNAKFYSVDNYFAVSGDVWGKNTDEKTITNKTNYSFNNGDHVTWKHDGEWYTGVVTGYKDINTGIVKFDNDGTLTDVDYKDLSIIDAKAAPVQQTVIKTDFQVNDKVTWKHGDVWYTGSIIALKDINSCIVKFDNDGDLTELKYTDLVKIATK